MKRKISFSRVLLYCVSLLMLGCTKKCGKGKDIPPEQQLYQYISLAVDIKYQEQRDDLINLTTGAIRSAIVNSSAESFQRAYIDRRYDFRSFDVVQAKEITPKQEYQIDFKIVYRTWLKGEQPERAPLQETVNRAILNYEHGTWLLSQVNNLETSFDWEIGLPLDAVKAQPGDEEKEPVQIKSSREDASQNAAEQDSQQ